MNETSKCYAKRNFLGHFDKYLKGNGIDVGCGRDCLKSDNAVVRAWDVNDGDGATLDGIKNNSLDFVYSSHFMEHVGNMQQALATYNRVLKKNGILYFVVPDFELYEKKCWPSKFNRSHVRSFSLFLRRNEIKRVNHIHIDEDLKPMLQQHKFSLLESYLEDDNYDATLPDSIDQTRIKEKNVLCQICVIAVKVEVTFQ